MWGMCMSITGKNPYLWCNGGHAWTTITLTTHFTTNNANVFNAGDTRTAYLCGELEWEVCACW